MHTDPFCKFRSDLLWNIGNPVYTDTLSSLEMALPKFRFSIRVMLLAILFTAGALFVWINTTFSFHSDLSNWPQHIPPQLEGRRIHLVHAGDSSEPFATYVKILSVDLQDVSDAKITVRLKPWQKWKVIRSGPQHAEWYCPPLARGGAISR